MTTCGRGGLGLLGWHGPAVGMLVKPDYFCCIALPLVQADVKFFTSVCLLIDYNDTLVDQL